MDVLVCAKQVAVTAGSSPLPVAPATPMGGARAMLDRADALGVETALGLVERAGGGEIVAVSVAARDDVAGLRTALAMGAARAVLVCDVALEGADALTTAKVLAAVVRRARPQLVVAGRESTDGRAGVVPVQLAELLGWPAVTSAQRVEASGASVVVERRTAHGLEELVCPLPCVLTVGAGAPPPRWPTFDGIVASRHRPLERLTLADLELAGPPSVQWAADVEPVPARRAGELVFDDGDGHERILRFLDAAGLV